MLVVVAIVVVVVGLVVVVGARVVVVVVGAVVVVVGSVVVVVGSTVDVVDSPASLGEHAATRAINIRAVPAFLKGPSLARLKLDGAPVSTGVIGVDGAERIGVVVRDQGGLATCDEI